MGIVEGLLGEFRAYLRSRGLRITSQRMKIAERVLTLGGHFTAKDIMAELPDVPKATVYRTLALLVEGGFLAQRGVPDTGETFYETTARPGHVHVFCIRCGRVWEKESPRVLSGIMELVPPNFKVLSIEITVRGVCEECQKKAKGG